jgi:DNA sulfur modification protein DndD
LTPITPKLCTLKNTNYQMKNPELEAKNYEKLQRGVALAQKVQVALEEYEMQLKKEKIGQLSQSLLDCLNELMHKEVYHGVVIDPDTFAVTLYDAQNHPIPKQQLSAGEKQIYAIAILWALARTSGRPLPFIVDTPLGRLDSDHRLNLVQNFFPVASHQVIAFSTDTEIDQKYFEDLSENICKSYKLHYDKEEGRTEIVSGYFWNMKGIDTQDKQKDDKEQEKVPMTGK